MLDITFSALIRYQINYENSYLLHLQTLGYVDSLISGDFDSNGVQDVICGEDGYIQGIDAQTGLEIGLIEGLDDDGVLGLSIGDYDGDGVNELSWCVVY